MVHSNLEFVPNLARATPKVTSTDTSDGRLAAQAGKLQQYVILQSTYFGCTAGLQEFNAVGCRVRARSSSTRTRRTRTDRSLTRHNRVTQRPRRPYDFS